MTEIAEAEVHDVHVVGELIDVVIEDGEPIVVVIEELITVETLDDEVVEVRLDDVETVVQVNEQTAVQTDADIVVEINPVGLPGPQGPPISVTVATVPPTPDDLAAENALWFVIA